MWPPLMTLFLNYQYLGFSSASQRPATPLPPGPPIPAQAVTVGLSRHAVDVHLERLAVGIAQHIHRNILSAQERSRLHSVPMLREEEWRRDLPSLTHRREVMPGQNLREGNRWIVYIDDFRHDEESAEEQMTVLPSTRSAELTQLLDFYQDNGMPGTLEDSRSPSARSLGEQVDGRLGRRDLPARYHAEAQDLVCWAGSQTTLAQQRHQVI